MLVQHVNANDCHFDSDVWTSPEMRADYEGYILAGAREGILPLPPRKLGPVWQYKVAGEYGRCHDQHEGVNTSCDHFGSAASGWRDDPQTKTTGDTLATLQGFEGRPLWLGLIRDEYGPYSGWFMIPQTSGPSFGTLVRACPPLAEGDDALCSPWIEVTWK